MALSFVTTNRHKFIEVSRIAREYGLEIVQVNMSYREVQSDSVEEVARVGAVEACRALGAPCFVEDSGLFIEALRGFPGPYSSFVFRTIGNRGILRLMSGEGNRRAKFMSAVGYCEPGKDPVVFIGEVEGRIAEDVRGSQGFGYDPVFIPDEGDGRTFGEMETGEKNMLSHRGRAIKRFLSWLADEKRTG
jgi:XTP/dITP diphosphohydrolase